ncbi:MAG TPA: hypothetical protein VLF61_03370, partial [Rhabdochlamydiaceae bacterium]|nr:hypothetical protein [Rhabdochlamydiaceae bacterium]
MKNILVIYYVPVAFELRKNTRDHIFSFREEAGAHVYFCNAYCTLPNYLNHIRFNLVIFHVTFSTFIQCATEYEAALPSYRNIKGISAPKVLLIQDEHHNAQRLCRFINEL